MGEVFKAVDLKLDQPVAIKTLPGDTSRDRIARRRFLQEARAASASNHPGIVTIYAIETVDDSDFIITERVSGSSVGEKIADGPMAVSELVTLGIQVADALAAAHAMGIVHRDVKPANIMILPNGQCRLLDFGLAKPLPDPQDHQSTTMGLTGVGVRVGTIAYMSPEQTRGETLDGRTDTFSLGCVLYEAASGTRPFDGNSDLDDLHWADTPSIDLLRHLCQRVGDQRLLLVATFGTEDVERRDHPLRGYRHELLERERCDELALPMLGSQHIENYLNVRFASNDFAHQLTSLIQCKTDGHPIFVTLLIQWLWERGDIVRSTDGWTLQHPISDEDVQAPQGVRSIIRTKLEALRWCPARLGGRNCRTRPGSGCIPSRRSRSPSGQSGVGCPA